jgi:hypothetical protein
MMTCNWKHNWEETRRNFNAWWAGRGLVLNLGDFPSDQPVIRVDDPGEAASPRQKHADAPWIAARSRALRANRNYDLGDILPVAFVDYGTVSLASYLGAEVELAADTIWYHPRPGAPEAWGTLRFDPGTPWFRIHEEVYRQCMAAAGDDFVIGQPGIGSNIEALAALRGSESLMSDLIDNPDWVHEKLREINHAFFAAYQGIYDIIQLADGSSCTSYFALWGAGKTSVITLDPIAMISPAMFEEFVLPPLVEQVHWLDHSLLHVDGTVALRHLDLILGIDRLNAVEWTPEPTVPGGGDPCWYPLYRRIKDAGKSVQAILVKPEEVVPLLDNVGPAGMYITAYCRDAAEAEALLRAVKPYRNELASNI